MTTQKKPQNEKHRKIKDEKKRKKNTTPKGFRTLGEFMKKTEKKEPSQKEQPLDLSKLIDSTPSKNSQNPPITINKKTGRLDLGKKKRKTTPIASKNENKATQPKETNNEDVHSLEHKPDEIVAESTSEIHGNDNSALDPSPALHSKEGRWTKTFKEKDLTPFGDLIYEKPIKRKRNEGQKSWHLRFLVENDKIVKNMEKGILLSVEYDGKLNKAFAKFYDLSDDSIKIWIDTTNHRPYCYHKASIDELKNINQLITYSGYDGMETVEKIDLLQDKVIKCTKIYGKTPTDIGGRGGIRSILKNAYEEGDDYEFLYYSDDEDDSEIGRDGAWEANIRYHHNFIYDRDLIPGMFYEIRDGIPKQIIPKIDKTLEEKLMDVFKDSKDMIREMARIYHPIFSTPIPELKRMAFDIEVEETPDGSLPDPNIARYRIISVSFAASDGLKRVYVLERPEFEKGIWEEGMPKDAKVFFFKNEEDLIIETFRLIWEYPIILTFNGDNFDNTYLYHRAKRLKIKDELNPIYIERGGGAMIRHVTDYKHSIHIDLFQFFANRSIKGYAFGGGYLKNSLEEISMALLGEGKVKHEGIKIGDMKLAHLIFYNMTDSLLTLELTQFDDHLVLNLIIILMRITKLPLQDVFRLQISAWIRSLLIAEHRRRNFLVPRKSELNREEGFSEATIEGKRFQGAYVVDPVPGIHFNVAVLDFSSLYPSIIKTKNLSYETVNCVHNECRSNTLPGTPYWACTKRMGIFAYMVGYLRDVRVKWYKPLSSNKEISPKERKIAKVMAAALKVFINGAYGVFGSPVFPLYCLRVAESTTAIGRFSIKKTIEKAEQMGIKVLYGDSDSVFLLNPTQEQINTLTKWSREELELDLELEKIYQFLALSERKKNYIGVRQGGKEVDIKGLMAKKHNTPNFIKVKFAEVQEILKEITNREIFNKKRNEIIRIIRETNKLIGKPPEKGGFKLEDYAITVVLKKPIKDYVKTMPQHVKAIKMLPPEEQAKYEPGSFVTYVKTRTKEGVKPLQYASLAEIDHAKYKEMVRSTFEQILDALGITYDEIQGVKKLSAFLK